MKIYLAGDLRCEAIRAYIDKLASLLSERGHCCLIPYRDVEIPDNTGGEKGLLAPGQHQALGEFVLQEDLGLLQKSDAAIFLLDGLCWGTSVELGYALALRKRERQNLRIIGLYTDPRGVDSLDVIRHRACDAVVTSIEEVAQFF